MFNTTLLSALGSRKKIFVSISFALLIFFPVAIQACAQWPCLWPDSNHLPAGATQSGNVFPGGNLWGGGTLYTPAHLPQRYLSWDFEAPHNSYPSIHGALDPDRATYYNANGTFIVGSDLYNLRGLNTSQTSSIPTSVSDPRWDRYRNGNVEGYFEEGVCGNPGSALVFGQEELVVFQVDNTGNHTPGLEKHAWISFNYCNIAVEGDSPLVVAFGSGMAIDGWYHLPADPQNLQWGWYGFAITITNESDNVSFGIGDLDNENLYIDNLQIATVCNPEPSTWELVALGGLVLLFWWRQRRNRVATLTLQPQRRIKIAKQFRTPYR